MKKKRAAAYAVLLVPFLFWCYEASGYIRFSHRVSESGLYYYNYLYSTNEQTWESFLHDHGYKKADFQAELLLPFFHLGSEKLWVADGGWLITLGAKASLQLQLPIVDVMMSRSSLSQTMKQVKIAGGPFAEKPLLDEIKSNKPFLLLRTDYDVLTPDQRYLLRAAAYIGHFAETQAYCFYPDRLKTLDKAFADSVATLLPDVRNDTVIGGDGNFFLEHYNSGVSSLHFFGPARPCIHGRDSTIAGIPMHYFDSTTVYELSMWFLLDKKDYRSPIIHLDLLNGGGAIIDSTDAATKQSTDNHGMWFRGNVFFRLKPGTEKVRCTMVNDPDPSCLAMDELMLRPANALVISKNPDGSVLVNNHVFTVRK